MYAAHTVIQPFNRVKITLNHLCPFLRAHPGKGIRRSLGEGTAKSKYCLILPLRVQLHIGMYSRSADLELDSLLWT
ncbi:hypothetical protein D3C81_2235520 [compost metagenome]